jgi:ABC-type nitrate/sulfonate/bicarbonate transport system substrate-binding protein
MTHRRGLRFGPIVGIGALVVSACGAAASQTGSPSSSGSTAPTTYTVKIDQPAATEAGAPLYVALKLGYFQAHHINVTFTTLNQDTTEEAALEAGSIDFATGGAYNIVEADEAGAGYEVIENFGTPTLQLCVRTAYAQQIGVTPTTPLKEMLTKLQGASFGVNGFGSPINIPLYFLLKSTLNVDPVSYVKVVNLASLPSMEAAMEHGQIDGIEVSPPTCGIVGGEVLYTSGLLPEFNNTPYQAFFGLKSWLQGHTAAAEGVAQAMAEGNAYVVNHPSATAALLHKYYFPTVSTSSLLGPLEQFYVHTIPPSGCATVAGWSAVNTAVLDAGVVTNVPSPGEGVMWTNQYLKGCPAA